MKDQYVGDYNDFVKYALLRAVLEQGLPLLVCWMLTENDESSDGRKLGYLRQRSRFRHLDPETFDLMERLVAADHRSVAAIERSELLPGACYFSRTLEDHGSSRTIFFRELWAEPQSVLFFDADNGFEIPSKPRGRRGSAKYVYWSELEEAFGRGHSVIVFQHFAREERTSHIRRLLERFSETTGSDAFSLRSANVAFFFAAQPSHEERLRRAARELADRWGQRLELVGAEPSGHVRAGDEEAESIRHPHLLDRAAADF